MSGTKAQLIPHTSIELEGASAYGHTAGRASRPAAPHRGLGLRGWSLVFSKHGLAGMALGAAWRAGPAAKPAHASPQQQLHVPYPARSEEHTSELQSHVK